MKHKKARITFVASLLAGTMCLALPFSVSAASMQDGIVAVKSDNLALLSETVECLPNGDSVTTKVYEKINPINISNQLFATAYTKDGYKTISYKDSNGKKLWTYTVTAKFKVEPNVKATCTEVKTAPVILDNAWSVYSNTPSRSGNTAKGVVVMQKKFDGEVVQKVTKTVTVKCSANGVIS